MNQNVATARIFADLLPNIQVKNIFPKIFSAGKTIQKKMQLKLKSNQRENIILFHILSQLECNHP